MSLNSSKPRILVVEDDWDLRDALCSTLEFAGFMVLPTECAEQALEVLSTELVDMVITDVNMGAMDGHELLAQIRAGFPFVPVVLITAYGSISQSVSAMRNGAVDYLVKPFKPETLVETVRKYVAVNLAGSISEPVAEEASSQQLLRLARRVAASDATVMISGESGTGKEVLARYIHKHSSRGERDFIAINCAAIPENMLEATLFGHEKGAFTGAYTSAPGKFEQADGGTILLDEISEMDIALQAKILRVLQEREVERVGGRRTIALDVRVIATTNRDLRRCVAEGSFREDLYYRLSVFPLEWLPLRERPADIVPLATRILLNHAQRAGRGSVSFSAAARQALLGYSWPGNVRELDNVIQRALILEDGGSLSAASLGLNEDAPRAQAVPRSVPQPGTTAPAQPHEAGDSQLDADNDAGVLGSDLKQREYEIILSTLKQQRGRRKETAEVLGVSARTLRYKIARMRDSGINIDSLLAR